MFIDPIRQGAEQAGRELRDLDLTVAVAVEFSDDVEATGRRHAEGYADDVRAVQRLWLSGDTEAARRRVPTAFGLGTNLIGTDDLVKDRLRCYLNTGVTTLRASFQGDPQHDLDRPLADLERLLTLVHSVNEETQGLL